MGGCEYSTECKVKATAWVAFSTYTFRVRETDSPRDARPRVTKSSSGAAEIPSIKSKIYSSFKRAYKNTERKTERKKERERGREK